MTGVPILTIPESAYDSSHYRGDLYRHRSRLLIFLIRLTNTSGIALTLAYVIGLFAIKPMMEVTATRRYDYLENFRSKLRELYLNLIGKVEHIPIVGIKRKGDVENVYADAICQTEMSYLQTAKPLEPKEADDMYASSDKLCQGRLLRKLDKLYTTLNQCESYNTTEIPHCRIVSFTVKDFQDKADMVYFNTDEFFATESDIQGSFSKSNGNDTNSTRKRQLNVFLKNEIRSIKGMYMSGNI